MWTTTIIWRTDLTKTNFSWLFENQQLHIQLAHTKACEPFPLWAVSLSFFSPILNLASLVLLSSGCESYPNIFFLKSVPNKFIITSLQCSPLPDGMDSPSSMFAVGRQEQTARFLFKDAVSSTAHEIVGRSEGRFCLRANSLWEYFSQHVIFFYMLCSVSYMCAELLLCEACYEFMQCCIVV